MAKYITDSKNFISKSVGFKTEQAHLAQLVVALGSVGEA
jgi:hypothetical protein